MCILLWLAGREIFFKKGTSEPYFNDKPTEGRMSCTKGTRGAVAKGRMNSTNSRDEAGGWRARARE